MVKVDRKKKQFRYILRRLRGDLTLAQLSQTSGVSLSHLGRVENGDRFPSATVVGKIARGLGMKEEELLFMAGYLSKMPGDGRRNAKPTKLAPDVVVVLAREPVEVQRLILQIIPFMKNATKVMSS